MREILNVDYIGQNHPMQKLDMWLPDEDGFDTLIYFHGGGLVNGDRTQYRNRFKDLPAEGIGIVSVEYRMLPDYHFPDFLYDCAASVRYVTDHVKQIGGNGRVFVSGASAGAYLTMMLCVDPKYLASVGVPANAVTGYISESAQQFAHFNILKYRGEDSRLERIDETAPIFFSRPGLEIQPLLIIYYDNDMICRPEENKLTYASMKRFVPEGTVLQLVELEGKHTNPVRPEDLTRAYSDFIHSV